MRIYEELKKLNLSTIVEAGGHLGEDTIKLHKMFPEANIYTFEPTDDLYLKLRSLVKDVKNITIIPYALSDKNGEANFYLEETGDGGASSLLPASEFFKQYVGNERETTVGTIRMDTFMNEFMILSVDFLWLDVEGFEYYILQHSPLDKIKYIYTEINYQEFRKGTSKYDDINNLLTSHGFEQVFIEPNGCDELGKWQANALFFNTKNI
jgi:FkbM family methyltransferase